MKTQLVLNKVIEKYKSNFLSDEYQKHHSKILNCDFYNVRKNIIKHSLHKIKMIDAFVDYIKTK